MESFAEIIDKIGVSALAAIFGVEESHVRTMKARDSIPPEYWDQVVELAPRHDLPGLSLATLQHLRKERFRAGTPGAEQRSVA